MLLRSRVGVREVARAVGSSASSVSRWERAMAGRGLRGLAALPIPGCPPGLTAGQRCRLAGLLWRGPAAHGFPTDL